MAGGGTRSPPPKVANSGGSRDGSEKTRERGKVVDVGEWKRGGRLRSNMQSKRDMVESDDGSEDSSMKDEERSLSPPLRRPSRSPNRNCSGRNRSEEERRDFPENCEMENEGVPPLNAPVHKFQNVSSLEPTFGRMEDVQMATNIMESHGKKQIFEEMDLHGEKNVQGSRKLEVVSTTHPDLSLASKSIPKHLSFGSLPSMGTSLGDGLLGKYGVSPSSGGPRKLHDVGESPPIDQHRMQPTKSLPLKNPTNSTVPMASQTVTNAWRPRKVYKFTKTEPLCEILGEDGVSIKLDSNEASSCRTKLEGAIVAKIIGKPLPIPFLARELHRRWAQFGKFQISPTGRDSFICLFDSMEARDAVLCGGPWFVGGQLIGMDIWSPKFNPASFKGITSSVWIRLPELPLQYWSPKNIGRIVTKIGVPLWMDDFTLNWERLEYARVCVKVDFSKCLPSGVWLQGSDDKFFQPFVYEGISQLCFKCGCVSHNSSSCPLNAPHSSPPLAEPSNMPLRESYNAPKSSTTPITSLNKVPKWADLVKSSTLPPPTTTPPDLEVHKSTPPPLRPSNSGETTNSTDARPEPKRPSTAPNAIVEEIGYGPWTLVTYKKKKPPVQRKGPPNGHPKRFDDIHKPLIFTATPKETLGRAGTTTRQIGKAWKPKATSTKDPTTFPLAAMVMGEIDLDGNRKRKKRNITVEFAGGDASPLVN